MTRPLTAAEILFPSAQVNINAIASELRRADHSVKNRLRSIARDAEFVDRVRDELGLPLIANERCGSWYVDPSKKTGSAYFKSTDGHFGQWSFSLRRLNLHLLETIQHGRGCIIVDSTRRGKSMPDALSKTIPIWITVLNRLLFPDNGVSHQLRTPKRVVSASEHAQIEASLVRMLEDVRALNLDLTQIRTVLDRPLRPHWITPGDDVLEESDNGTWPVVLCTASSRESVDAANDASYVQGAADDHESWAHGLTATLFWQHRRELLRASDEELDAMIQALVQGEPARSIGRARYLVKPTTHLLITENSSLVEACDDIDLVIYASKMADAATESHLRSRKIQYVHIGCGDGKVGSRQLRAQLVKLDTIPSTQHGTARILCSCPSGRDVAVGVALALLCKHFSANGSQVNGGAEPINKMVIKQRLSWIMVSMPDAAPSRATLQSVNAYLMS